MRCHNIAFVCNLTIKTNSGMKRNWKNWTRVCGILLLGICAPLFACSDGDEPLEGGTPGTEGPGYSNDEEITGEEDLQIAVIKASGTTGQNAISATDMKKMYDNDKSTFYQSGRVSENNLTLTYVLNGTETVDYCVYTPGNRNGAWGKIEVYVKENATGADFVKVADKNLGFPEWPVTIFFEGKKKIREVKFVVKSGFNDNARCAEMEFFRRVNPEFNPLTLFTDATCSELKDGITETEIEACGNPFYETIAKAMLAGTYPREFRIQDFKARMLPVIQANENKTNGFSLYENVTGIYVKRNETLTVFVGDIPASESVSLKIINFEDQWGYYNGMSVALRPGFNQIKTENKGLVYVAYHNENPETTPPVKIHFATGAVNGYFDTSKHTREQWSNIINNTVCDFFDIVGKRVQITFAANDFKNNCNDPFALMDIYDQFVELSEEFTGMKKYRRTLKNRVFYHYCSDPGGGMGAFGNHILWNNAKSINIPGATTPDKLKNDPWGPVHELGHELQIRPGKQLYTGMTEVTNNLLSIYVQLQLGNNSRLFTQIQTPAGTAFQSDFERAMTWYGAEKRAHNYAMGSQRTVLTKLVPLWQLYLYFNEVLGEDDWFKDYYEEMRKSNVTSKNGEAQMEQIRILCRVSGLNLLDFFEHTGFLTPFSGNTEDGSDTFTVTQKMIDDIKTEISAKGYTKPDVEFWRLTDQTDNIKAFKEKLSVSKGSATRSTDYRTYTMTGWQNVAAYEVETGGKLVFVSPHQKFTVEGNVDSSTQVYAVSATGERTKVTF